VDTLTIEDLAETWGDEQIPATERMPASPLQSAWRRDGVVVRRGLLDDELMDRYEGAWLHAHGGPAPISGKPSTYASPMGWSHATPYMDCAQLLDVCCDGAIAATLTELIGEPAGVHLNLTGWQSTRRNWHFDQYLNEPYVGAFYVAVWIALDDIDVDAGPFEYVSGSHHWWSPISQAKMRRTLGTDGEGPDWPTHSERILTPLFERELAERDVTSKIHLPRRGDVLFWHSRLLHRGSIPRDESLERRALIAHYSGIHHRPDMPPAIEHPAGGWFFPLGGRQPVRGPS